MMLFADYGIVLLFPFIATPLIDYCINIYRFLSSKHLVCGSCFVFYKREFQGAIDVCL